ncbi:hypothetical protein F8388_024990 [Cannabis sativa]|uniref:Uncharacterized protein n=1 Tax=Cannabis sativa TaxID=3483 RepID=A0A7J6G5Z8_CANSA|nr:hypothetical protein F8388_024990 [Cannabis sativa]
MEAKEYEDVHLVSNTTSWSLNIDIIFSSTKGNPGRFSLGRSFLVLETELTTFEVLFFSHLGIETKKFFPSSSIASDHDLRWHMKFEYCSLKKSLITEISSTGAHCNPHPIMFPLFFIIELKWNAYYHFNGGEQHPKMRFGRLNYAKDKPLVGDYGPPGGAYGRPKGFECLKIEFSYSKYTINDHKREQNQQQTVEKYNFHCFGNFHNIITEIVICQATTTDEAFPSAPSHSSYSAEPEALKESTKAPISTPLPLHRLLYDHTLAFGPWPQECCLYPSKRTLCPPKWHPLVALVDR